MNWIVKKKKEERREGQMEGERKEICELTLKSIKMGVPKLNAYQNHSGIWIKLDFLDSFPDILIQWVWDEVKESVF